jgi:hypothetical protein
MVRSSHWFMDWTFRNDVTVVRSQIYTFHIPKQGHALPMVFALLPDKTAFTDEPLFRCFLQSKPQLQPSSGMTDFEAAASVIMLSI